MESPAPRWSLLGTSTNSYNVRFFTLSCRDAPCADGDYEELIELLMKQFGAAEVGELVGPYSVHKYLEVDGVCLGIILDSPDCLDLYAKDEHDKPAVEAIVTKLL